MAEKFHCDECDVVIDIGKRDCVMVTGAWHGKPIDGAWCNIVCLVRWLNKNGYGCGFGCTVYTRGGVVEIFT